MVWHLQLSKGMILCYISSLNRLDIFHKKTSQILSVSVYVPSFDRSHYTADGRKADRRRHSLETWICEPGIVGINQSMVALPSYPKAMRCTRYSTRQWKINVCDDCRRWRHLPRGRVLEPLYHLGSVADIQDSEHRRIPRPITSRLLQIAILHLVLTLNQHFSASRPLYP